jgi:hypothetical protein
MPPCSTLRVLRRIGIAPCSTLIAPHRTWITLSTTLGTYLLLANFSAFIT